MKVWTGQAPCVVLLTGPGCQAGKGQFAHGYLGGGGGGGRVQPVTGGFSQDKCSVRESVPECCLWKDRPDSTAGILATESESTCHMQ